jgi:hypothetical protein
MTVRAIPTVYDGELYRSRLEIRWKIFFESLGIESSYEPEKFSLVSGGYIPDLWLPQNQIFVEIKSHGNQLSPDDPIRYKELADQTGAMVIRIKGYPMPGRYSVRLFVPRRLAGDYPKLYWANFAEANGNIYLVEGTRTVAITGGEQNVKTLLRPPLKHTPRILAAMHNARTANYRIPLSL